MAEFHTSNFVKIIPLAISSVFLFSGLQAAALPKDAKVETIDYPSGGLNTSVPSFRLESKFSPYTRNVFVDDGRMEGINGFQTLGSSMTLQKVTGIFPFYRETGQTTFLVTDSSITLETSDFNSWTFVSSGSNTGSLLTWMQARNKMWGFNGTDAVITWNGTSKVILNGSNNTPDVPKFKYGAYWQERVWGFNDSDGASDLNFSSISSTDGIVINPDDSRAWPGTNILRIGQGDGEVGTALWVKDGQLKCGKERSQHTVYGTSASNYFARKEESNSVGVVSNESVVNMDGSTYYLSQDGIYKDTERISDLIDPDVELIDRGISKTVSDTWESQADFSDKGRFFYGSTATDNGFLTLETLNPNNSNPTGGGGFSYVLPTGVMEGVDPPDLNSSTTFWAFRHLEFNTGISTTSRLVPNRILWGYSDVVGCALVFASVTIKNEQTGVEEKAIAHLNPSVSRMIATFSTTSASSVIFDGLDLNRSSMAVKVEGCGMDISNLTTNGEIHFINSTTGQYLSQVTTIPMVTAWGNVESIRNTNGGSINYFIRSSTSVINITTQTWKSIVPGSVISEPTINKYIQFASTIMSVSTYASVSNIDNVQIIHIEGTGATNRAFGISWKNRYWLSTSTESSGNLSLIYVKSKITNENPNAWMPIEGINIRSIAKASNVLYGGSASTGTVYRLDYGSNYDGAPIQYIYDTPDMILGSNYFSKSVHSYLLDAEQDSGLNLTLGTSIDFGSYSNRTISLDGSGRVLKPIYGVIAPNKTLRLRLSHRQLDKKFKINNLSVIYTPTEILEPK